MTKRLFLLLLSLFLIGSLSVYGLGGGEGETAQAEGSEAGEPEVAEGDTGAAESEPEVAETEPAPEESQPEVAQSPEESPDTTAQPGMEDATGGGVAGAASFSDWDSDMDGNLNQDELAQGFSQWNQNQDDYLGAEEIQTAPISEQDFTAWDADADGQLTEDEFTQGAMQTYDMDGDQMLSEEEASGLFGSGS